jgi:hypothetical protein
MGGLGFLDTKNDKQALAWSIHEQFGEGPLKYTLASSNY